KEQSAAFIRDERCLICWSDNLDHIIPTCQDIDEKLIALIWRHRPNNLRTPQPSVLTAGTTAAGTSPFGSESYLRVNGGGEKSGLQSPEQEYDANGKPIVHNVRRTGDEESSVDEKKEVVKKSWFGWKTERAGQDVEAGKPAKRPTRLLAPIYNGIGAGLCLYFMGNGVGMLLREYWIDHDPMRFALVVTVPFLFCVSLFFAMSVIGIFTQAFGPVAQYHQNSKYYSAVRPAQNEEVDNNLPHITIQMPVYKESLKETIAPSCESLKKAMQTYARQGGTSTIMICDDAKRTETNESGIMRIMGSDGSHDRVIRTSPMDSSARADSKRPVT
ncbi:hypothetical protein FRC18_004096, partial [Serendipita sp. 400]